jgi:hypothetical protein
MRMYLHAIVATSFVGAACGSLVAAPDDEAPVLGPSDGGDAPIDDAGIEAEAASPQIAAPLPCGDASCEAGQTCCGATGGRTCAATCGQDVYRFDCFSSDQCADAAAPTCCFSLAVASCSPTCKGHVMCASSAECGGAACVAANCGGSGADFLVCPRGSPDTLKPTNAPQCVLP